MNQNKRILYLDYLRILSIFSVCLLHAAAQKWSNVDIISADWKILNFYDSIVRWSVPVFVMISGALFLDHKKTFHLKSLYSKSILRIACAYTFWSMIYVSDRIMRGASLQYAVTVFIQGESHLWFVFMIIGLYVLVPLLRKITESKDLEQYFLIIGFIFAFLLPRIFDLLGVLPSTKDWFIIPPFKKAIGHIDFHFAAGHIYYFVLGHYLSTTSESKWLNRILYSFCLLSFFGIYTMTNWYSMLVGQASTKYYGNFTMFSLIISISVFLFGKNELSRFQPHGFLLKIIFHLSKCSFGIYLVHMLVMNKLNAWFNINVLSFSPIIGVPFITSIVFLVSYLISAFFNSIPFLNKYLV